MIEAQSMTDLIMSDDWHELNGEYDHVENGKAFVISFNQKMKTVTIFYGNDESAIYHWQGTKDHMTRAFRDWLHKFVNANV